MEIHYLRVSEFLWLELLVIRVNEACSLEPALIAKRKIMTSVSGNLPLA